MSDDQSKTDDDLMLHLSVIMPDERRHLLALLKGGTILDCSRLTKVEKAAPELLEALQLTMGLVSFFSRRFNITEDFVLEVKDKDSGEIKNVAFSRILRDTTVLVAKAKGKDPS